MAQELNTPMTIPDISEDAWVEDDGSSIPGGSDEDFIAKVNAMDGGVPVAAARTGEPDPPSMTHTDVDRVRLPVPMDHPVHGELRMAEVRELNGEDEEFLNKGRARNDKVNRLVARGTVELEGVEVDEATVRAMPIGNREALMLAIRRATYGDELDLDLVCRSCSTENPITVDLATEVGMTEGSDEATVEFRRGGEAVIRWPNGDDEAAIMRASEKNRSMTAAEMNTLLLSRILISVNGQQAVGENTAKRLRMPDRSDIVDFVDKNQPGPDYSGITHECTECGAKSSVVFGYEDMFR